MKFRFYTSPLPAGNKSNLLRFETEYKGRSPCLSTSVRVLLYCSRRLNSSVFAFHLLPLFQTAIAQPQPIRSKTDESQPDDNRLQCHAERQRTPQDHDAKCQDNPAQYQASFIPPRELCGWGKSLLPHRYFSLQRDLTPRALSR